jgi:23S rRNA pseudoU1915 N3-methylase RlmH
MRTEVALPVLLLCMLTTKRIAGFLPGNQARSNAVSRGTGGGLKVNIRIVGRKQSEKWIEEGCEMYETRMRANGVSVETTWHKDNAALIKNVQADWTKQVPVVLLDPLGKSMTSEMFAAKFYRWIEDGGSRLVLVIGGGTFMYSRTNTSALP